MSPRDPRSHLSTRWSMLDRLGESGADDAWRWFIDRYRPFVRAVLSRFLRTRGRTRELGAAVEEFWAYLFSSEVFENADRTRRFRSFLAGTLRNFAREYTRKHPLASADLDDEDEERATPEPAVVDPLPENVELRLFAHQILHLALTELEQTHPENAFAIRWFYGIAQDPSDLTSRAEPMTVAEIAQRVGQEPNAVHQVLHRARKRLRQRIEVELRDTMLDDDDFDGEVATILTALADDAPGILGG